MDTGSQADLTPMRSIRCLLALAALLVMPAPALAQTASAPHARHHVVRHHTHRNAHRAPAHKLHQFIAYAA